MATFPGGVHPDMLDALARIKDPEMMAVLKFPKTKKYDLSTSDYGRRFQSSYIKPRTIHWLDS